MGAICENKLEKTKEYKWKIKILNFYLNLNNIKVGVAPVDFDINSSSYNYGWYLDCSNSYLYSGSPQNYNGNSTNLSKVKDEITIILSMQKRTIKFIINNEDKGESFTNIPLDKQLTPAVFLYYTNDSVKIIEC